MILTLALLAFPQVDAASDRRELAELQPTINEAIDDGVSYLLEQQLMDGSWDHLSELYPTGATALCVLALLKSGLSPEHPNVQAALKTMLAMPPEETYSAGVQLMALEATRREYYHNSMEPILESILGWSKKGGWSYPADRGGDKLVPVKGTLDLSNIQYAALGLRAAAFAEYEIKPKVWKNIAKETMTYQGESGGFKYWNEKHSRFPVTGSMTSAGIAILSMARAGLGKRATANIDESIERAVQWLGDNISFVKNPSARSREEGNMFDSGAGGHYFYYMFGLERVGSFLDQTHIGKKNWYLEGAKRIVKRQKSDGSWNDPPTTLELRLLTRDESSSALSDTCFALLFLRRASARSGEQSVKPDSYSSDEETDDVVLRASGSSGGITVWIAGFNDRMKKQFGSGDVVAGLRVAEVTYLVDGEPVGKVTGNPKKPWRASDRYSHNVWLSEGEHEISVRVSLVPPDALLSSRDGTVAIQGDGFSAEVGHYSQRFNRQLTGLARRNLVGAGSKLEVSSNEAMAEFAIDRVFATRWLSDPSDKEPQLDLQLKRATKCSTLYLCQAARHRDERRDYDRITRLALRVNRQKEPLIIEFDNEILAPLEIEFEEPVSVRTLELKIVGREQGARSDGQLGFSEIALW